MCKRKEIYYLILSVKKQFLKFPSAQTRKRAPANIWSSTSLVNPSSKIYSVVVYAMSTLRSFLIAEQQ